MEEGNKVPSTAVVNYPLAAPEVQPQTATTALKQIAGMRKRPYLDLARSVETYGIDCNQVANLDLTAPGPIPRNVARADVAHLEFYNGD